MGQIPVAILIGVFGLIIGSFLNVCIYRIPLEEDIVEEPSHCMTCGYRLQWYDLIPLISYVVLKGKCRNCHAHISLQYPLVEATNGLLYLIIFLIKGFQADTILYCLLASALIVLSVIDARTYEIPFGINVFIGVLGIAHLILHSSDWPIYVIGFFSVSLFLEILFLASGGRAIGGGDIKLTAAAGLLLGWQEMLLAFGLACIIGSVCHLIIMKTKDAGHMLAMGPYLAIGILLSALFGQPLIDWYLALLVH